MAAAPRRLVIVGGGTAGWLTAAYLVKRLASAADEPALSITLVEASDIPPIGVGEATVPSIRNTLAAMGVDEYQFMRECDATFKHGIRFDQWCHPPDQKPGEYFYHPFQRPVKAGFDSLAGYWLRGVDPYRRSFANAVSVQPRVSDALLAPKCFEHPAYDGPLPYAYHLDAGKLAVFLKKLALGAGVKHVVGKVAAIDVRADGAIHSLRLATGAELAADIFIDCSGFQGLLIGQHYREDWVDLSPVLFCDKAIACQVPNLAPDQPIRPYTLSTAQSAGWIWDIGLKDRRGTGHVFASDYMSADEAEAILRRYIGRQAMGVGGDALVFRTLDLRVGYRRQQWRHNCIAVGLSGGFLEPLESTGIHLIELALYMLEKMLPRYFAGASPQDHFNQLMRNQYDISIDFVKLHYYLSSRTDSAFWRDNIAATSATAELREKVAAWATSYPDIYDMRVVHSVFDHMGYQYIYFGMGRGASAEIMGHGDTVLAKKIFQTTYGAFDRALKVLPSHRAIVDRIHNAAPDNY